MSGVLAAAGIAPLEGYRSEHVTEDLDLVVVGNAVSRGNPEVETVLDRRLRYCSLPELVRDTFLRGRRADRGSRDARQDHHLVHDRPGR